MAIKKKVTGKKAPAKPAAKKVAAPAPAKKKPKPAPVEELDELEDEPEVEDLEMDEELGADTADELADQDEEDVDGYEDFEEQDTDDSEESDEGIDEVAEIEEEETEEEAPKASRSVAVRGSTSVGAASNLAAWGKPKVSADDIIMPRIQLLQQMSPRVATPAPGQKRAELGQFRDSLSDKLLGTPEKPLQVIPFYMQKIWVIYRVINNKGKTKKEFDRVEQVTPQNEKRRTQATIGGVNYEFDKVYTFFVLRPQDIATQENPMAYTISFRRTGAMAGKKMATQMYVTNLNEGKVPSAYVMNVHSQIVTGENIYAKPDVSKGREATPEECEAAYKWYQLAESGAARVDEAEFDAGAEGSSRTAKPVDTEDTEY